MGNSLRFVLPRETSVAHCDSWWRLGTSSCVIARTRCQQPASMDCGYQTIRVKPSKLQPIYYDILAWDPQGFRRPGGRQTPKKGYGAERGPWSGGTRSYGDKPLFEMIGFRVNLGQREVR